MVADNFSAGKAGAWPVSYSWILAGFHHVCGGQLGFLVRDVLENIESYDAAVTRFSEVPLMAPSYIILAGAAEGEGVW